MKIIRFVFLALIFLALAVPADAGDADSLVARATELYRQKNYAAAAATIERAIAAGASRAVDFYNAGCFSALAGDADAAFAHLGKAIAAGFLNDDQMFHWDTDLESLRDDPRWEELQSTMAAKIEEANAALPVTHVFLEEIVLPAPRHEGPMSLEETLLKRRSRRAFDERPLTLADVSQLLWATYGVTFHREGMPAFLRGGLKTAPSAGARYPLEIYLVAGNVTGLMPGVYLYLPEGHRIARLADGDVREALTAASWDQRFVAQAAVSIVMSAVYERTTARYGQRGRDRYVCMDLGHAGQNVYLQAEAMGMGTCAIGAFTDLDIKRVVGMTREEEPLYVMPVGYPAE